MKRWTILLLAVGGCATSPIVGEWTAQDVGVIRIAADGSYTAEHKAGNKSVYSAGRWSRISDNQYQITAPDSGDDPGTFTLSPAGYAVLSAGGSTYKLVRVGEATTSRPATPTQNNPAAVRPDEDAMKDAMD